MKKETYIKMVEYINARRNLKWLIEKGNKILTLSVYVFYPCFLAYIFTKGYEQALRALLVPGISFAAVSVFRNIVNCPRPYEVFDYPSVVYKDTKGKSFPSRHIFSCFVIGFTALQYVPAAGISITVIGIFLAAARVAGGIHFTKDVLGGVVFALVSVLIGFA